MNKFLFVFLGSLVIIHVKMYSQHEYEIVFDHIESAGYNKYMLYYLYAKSVKPNRTYKAIEVGFRTKRDFSGDNFKAHIEALQFFHNEYRRTPILFDVKVCDVLELKIFGLGKLLSENGNITKRPLRKGTYLIHDFNFDSTAFPPHIPRGRWKLQLRIMLDKTDLGGLNYYGVVKDVLKY